MIEFCEDDCYREEVQGREVPINPLYSPVRDCMVQNDDEFACTRPTGHVGDHAAHGLRGELCARWPLCWINPRLPNYCPECGTFVYSELKDPAQGWTKHSEVLWLRKEPKRTYKPKEAASAG